MNSFQERFDELLKDNGLSRLSLAKKLNISSTAINGYFNNNYYPQIDIAIKICEYFDCSLDYLFGRSDNINNNDRNNNDFIENFHKLLKFNNISITKTMRELKMSEFNYYRWKNGKFPKTINLIDIANYFDVSIDYLVGKVNK